MEKSEENLALLHEIKNLGVSIVLDDFGIGYSSMRYLQMFPFDKIKIDKSFIQSMTTHSDSAAIVCAITGLGRGLDIETTAEGVETAEQLAFLRTAGCQLAQGYLFSRPVPLAAALVRSAGSAAQREGGLSRLISAVRSPASAKTFAAAGDVQERQQRLVGLRLLAGPNQARHIVRVVLVRRRERPDIFDARIEENLRDRLEAEVHAAARDQIDQRLRRRHQPGARRRSSR